MKYAMMKYAMRIIPCPNPVAILDELVYPNLDVSLLRKENGMSVEVMLDVESLRQDLRNFVGIDTPVFESATLLEVFTDVGTYHALTLLHPMPILSTKEHYKTEPQIFVA